MTVKATYEDDLQKVNKKFELEVKQLKQQVEMEKKSVARKVNKELSEIGVSRFVAEEISKSDNNLSPESICKKFTDMPESQEKHLFFEANEKVISRFMKNQQ
jgi:hypothetical protein